MAVGESDFFADYAKRYGIKPPINVEQRLRAMMYMAGGDNSIHVTQLAVTASLLNAGAPIDVNERVLIDVARLRIRRWRLAPKSVSSRHARDVAEQYAPRWPQCAGERDGRTAAEWGGAADNACRRISAHRRHCQKRASRRDRRCGA
jgi:hypothetical protein